MPIEWSLVLFSLLAGCGGGALVFVGISELLKVAEKPRFNVALIATILIVVGGCFSVLHLQRPDRIMWAAQNVFSFSGISIELIFVGLCVVLGIVYLVLVKRGSAETARKVIAILALVCGLLLAFFTGHGYVIESRANWNTQMLPLAYTGTALAAGGFLFLLVAALQKVDEAEFKKMALWGCIAAVLCAVTLIGYVAVIGFDTAAVSGIALWGGIIICGVIITIAAGILGWLKPASGAAVAGCGFAAALIAGLALRALMWLVGTGFYSLFDVAATVRLLM